MPSTDSSLDSATALTPSSSKTPKVSDREVFSLIASDPKYGRRHLRPEREYWDPQDFQLYKKAKAELEKKALMNGLEEDDMEYVAPDNREPKQPMQFGNPIAELSFRMSEYLENNPDKFKNDIIFNNWARVADKLDRMAIDGEPLTPKETKFA